ncbi:MAG: family 2 glycosyl transferase [Cyclobacteriaceae bacterium]
MTHSKSIYFDRYAYPKRYLNYTPKENTGIIAVIPCHNELDLISSLEAICNCERPCPIEVIVVVNASESSSEEVKEQNRLTVLQAGEWWQNQQIDNISLHLILENELPKKHAGVGLARKIGMDEAVRMFESIGNADGVILCFDADSTCSQNLLTSVFQLFQDNPNSPGCSINFEHPLDGDMDKHIYEAITYYELHLRYYVDALKWAGFPFAYHTIGSSMAVRSSAYQKQGGMNRRKAGEDFYFLHKIIPLGGFEEINDASVYPSPRASDRVPFGTGKAVGDWIASGQAGYVTYSYESFCDLRAFLDCVDDFYNASSNSTKQTLSELPQSICEFLRSNDFTSSQREIKKQSTSLVTFRKRFFQWFDGFRVLKFVHFSRDDFYPNISTEKAVNWLMQNIDVEAELDLKANLNQLRALDKSGAFKNNT